MTYADTITIAELEADPFPIYARLRREEPLIPVPAANCWFASRPAPGSSYCFSGCTVAPGFDFADFEMADAKTLTALYPQHKSIIKELCR